MKAICFLIFCMAVTMPFRGITQERSLDDLAWLEGKWIRTNANSDRKAYEQWTRHSKDALIGIGVSLRGSDTVFVEKLKIVLRNDSLFYVADVPENKAPVYFSITSMGTTSFVCENPRHDFPKMIRYALSDGVLTGTISGDGRSQNFVFKRE